jgi:hypothetical protein
MLARLLRGAPQQRRAGAAGRQTLAECLLLASETLHELPERRREAFRDVERPFRDVERPFRDVERPFRDVERPFRDVERPFRDVERPFRDVERPFRALQELTDGLGRRRRDARRATRAPRRAPRRLRGAPRRRSPRSLSAARSTAPRRATVGVERRADTTRLRKTATRQPSSSNVTSYSVAMLRWSPWVVTAREDKLLGSGAVRHRRRCAGRMDASSAVGCSRRTTAPASRRATTPRSSTGGSRTSSERRPPPTSSPDPLPSS